MVMQLLKITRELYRDNKEKIEPLLSKHWEELAKNKDLMELAPDYEAYDLMERNGSLVCLFAKDDEGNIVGYSGNIINRHLHYVKLNVAYNDLIFLLPEYRNFSYGKQLIEETKRVCKEEKARMMLWHVKEGTALAKILPAMGCSLQELIYTEEL